MTKKEIAEIIESKAAEYGFEIQRYPVGWSTRQTGESYIRIDINENENEEKSDWDRQSNLFVLIETIFFVI